MSAEILKSVKMFIRVTDVYLGGVFTWARYCLREQNSVWLELGEYTVSGKHGLRINKRLCTLYWNVSASPKCRSFLPKVYAGRFMKWHAQI